MPRAVGIQMVKSFPPNQLESRNSAFRVVSPFNLSLSLVSLSHYGRSNRNDAFLEIRYGHGVLVAKFLNLVLALNMSGL